MTNPLLEPSPYAVDDGELIGRDPREVTVEEFREEVPKPVWGLDAVRAKCLDCAHSSVEVRKCVQTTCPLWPLRMGAVPINLKRAGGFIPKSDRADE